MNEIFIDIVDSVFYDIRLSPLPKKPYLKKGISDSLKNEKLKNHKLFLAERKIEQEKIKTDTSRIVLAIYDTISMIRDRPGYRIDLSQLKESEKFIFKYYSIFPKENNIYKSKYPFYFGGIINFSRIKFNENKDYGELSVAVGYYIQDAEGFDIYIKKDKNGKWIIDKVVGTWIT